MLKSILIFLLFPLSLYCYYFSSIEILAQTGKTGGMGKLEGFTPYQGAAGPLVKDGIEIGYTLIGTQRVYYSTYLQLSYQDGQSYAGGMNLLGVNLGLAGIGVYLSKPLDDYKPNKLKDSFFALFELSFLTFSFGGNATPNKGIGTKEWIDLAEQFGNKRYAFGEYTYFRYSFPISIKMWGMITNTFGLGFKVSAQPLFMEIALNKEMPIGFGFNLSFGMIFILL